MPTNILTDVSDEALVTAIRANMCDLFRHLSRSSPIEHFETNRFTRWYTPLPHPWFTGALSSGLPVDDDDAFIVEVIEHFRHKGVNAFTWWLEPHLHPADWQSVLAAHGFGFSNDTPGMAVDLHTLYASMPTVDRSEIRAVTDEESLRIWAKIFVDGYGLPPTWEAMTYDMWLQLGLDLPMRNYLGYLNGKPVATSTLFLGGGAGGIYAVATLPEARGKGLGAALTLQPLLDAREMGYRVGVLQSSEMGFNVYKKLGFRHLCQIENFYLSLK
jgi:ribosomal protein S18 acetylase RimI-like enzyme